MSAATQDLPRDRTREFEMPPPPSHAPAVRAATPPRLRSWVSYAIDAAPPVLGALLVIAVLRRRTGRRLVRRALLSLVVAGAVAGGAFYATYLAGCRAMQCVDTAGLVPMLAGLGVGFAAGVAALVVVWRRVG